MSSGNAASGTGGRRLPSVRRLVVWIVCVPVVLACAVLVVIATAANRRVAAELRNQLLEQAGTSVAEKTRLYLGDAMQVSDLYARRMEGGRLATRDFAAWGPVLADDLATHPRVASVCFGNSDGGAIWLQRRGGRVEMGIAPGGAETRAAEYATDPAGRGEPGAKLREYAYDPRRRPWYGIGSVTAEGVWTPVYSWVAENGETRELAVGYTRAIRDAGGRVTGVLVVDVTPGALGDFLRRLPVAQRGRVYVVDEAGLVVAASDGKVLSAEGKRVGLGHELLGAGFEPRRVTGGKGGPAWVTVSPLAPFPGLNWRAVTVLPEAAFMGPVDAMQRNSAVLAVACGVGALLLGLRLSGRLSGPLLKLAGHVSRVGKGDFESRLELGGARELKEVAGEVNRMAAGLRERVALEQSMALAAHVQKSLLPAGPPAAAGVEVAGQSRYCDATGGDYFDFIEVRQVPGDGVLIAVGDVMGHGIGAAMLMATARAALRAAAGTAKSLGELMGCVNRVLSEDARHGLFMTMALVHVDAAGGRVRWASAGHDPTIVYDPRTGEFEELEGGDVPLGITEGIAYEEYERALGPAGQVLVVGTDGIWEARDEGGEMFGKERMKEVIRSAAGGSAGDVAKALEGELARFVGGAKVLDDVTFVVARVLGEKGAARDGVGDVRAAEQVGIEVGGKTAVSEST